MSGAAVSVLSLAIWAYLLLGRGWFWLCRERDDAAALESTRPVVAALHSPSPDGRSSERPLERGDAVSDRINKSDSTDCNLF